MSAPKCLFFKDFDRPDRSFGPGYPREWLRPKSFLFGMIFRSRFSMGVLWVSATLIATDTGFCDYVLHSVHCRDRGIFVMENSPMAQGKSQRIPLNFSSSWCGKRLLCFVVGSGASDFWALQHSFSASLLSESLEGGRSLLVVWKLFRLPQMGACKTWRFEP